MMREAADLLVSSGMADAGYQYVKHWTDCWMKYTKSHGRCGAGVGPLRGTRKVICCPISLFSPGHERFWTALHPFQGDLKPEFYTSPGVTTCAGFLPASFRV